MLLVIPIVGLSRVPVVSRDFGLGIDPGETAHASPPVRPTDPKVVGLEIMRKALPDKKKY